MEAPAAASGVAPVSRGYEPNIDAIKRRLLKKGVFPTPKILHNLRRKQIQKHNRKLNKSSQDQFHKQQLYEISHFQKLKREYKVLTENTGSALMVGRPWESIDRVKLREIASGSNEYDGGKFKRENLRELRELFERDLRWVLDDDIEVEDGWLGSEEQRCEPPKRRQRSEAEAIGFLVHRLSGRKVTVRDWKLARMMKQSGLKFSEGQLLKIVDGLGNKGCWEQAMGVVEWVYTDKERKDSKSRFVYTKLLAVLGKSRRPLEALGIFNIMRGDCNIYPDIAAYHSIAVTLAQAGLLKQLMAIIQYMRQKPCRKLKNMRYKNWDPLLEPDLVVYNAVLNACNPSHQWKGVSWVFEQLRKSGLKPNGATYGLAMEVLLQCGKYDLVHDYFRKMKRSGETPKALTYKVLVRTFWEEGKVNEAVKAVRDMEQRGVVGTASVYYELACCLCNNGRWQDAMLEVEKMKKLPHIRPLVVTFTGMILSSMDGGHIDDCRSIFDRMKDNCVPNIGTFNAMLKVYGRNDLFPEAKELFEEIKQAGGSDISVVPDEYTYSLMLEASASAHQWEYFESVYKDMALSGYQLDQSKHATLLVEASIAGKSYLMEHAFEEILDAGEVPNPLFFTEMVLQATAQHNYERAITLVNTMAYAPFQVSERQWTDLFGKNGDIIGQDKLEKLLDALGNCDVESELTVTNLSRSLQSLCGSGTSGAFSSSIISHGGAISKSSLDRNNGWFDDNKRSNAATYASMMSGIPDLGEDALGEKTNVTQDKIYMNGYIPNGENEVDIELSGSPIQVCDKDKRMNLCTNMGVYADDVALVEFTDCLESRSNFILNRSSKTSVDKVDDLHESELPSAYEILDSWKESREKDGILFPSLNGTSEVVSFEL